ncbi:PTS beta-glucoside transporter subunit EIIBCA [Bifidobacterium primatium]|uniref:PTS beta-glucoside transporter subunit EIIBCA n=1 Tax=Bifidobacterium primatium TaxID=2045438 RepID=A0A2M9HAU7_9BIFI|nr:glucose PTS transporter subunit IIA [Bifidobacterium primatium]PJM73911.1 PTS beta-glucoside transporter subunit EIIBCA [Bifidobacterium primatium]
MRTEDRRVARAIVVALGGAGNIRGLTHCATRLRFELRDASRVDARALDADPAVLGAVAQYGERYQVVIGGAVEDVYDAMMAMPAVRDAISSCDGDCDVVGDGGMADDAPVPHVPDAVLAAAPAKADSSAADPAAAAPDAPDRTDSTPVAHEMDTTVFPSSGVFAMFHGKRGITRRIAHCLNWFFEYLSDSFRPIIGVLLGASIIIALVNLCLALGVMPNDEASAGWVFVKAMWKGVFVFLPIIVAYNASNKLRVDPWLGAMIMAALMTPQFTGLMNAADADCVTDPTLGVRSCTVHVFGLPMHLNDYSGNVFVPLIMVLALAALYRGLKRVLPRSIRIVFLPFVSMVVITPLTAFVLGPFGAWLSNGIGVSLAWLSMHAPFAFAVLLPLIYPFIVPIGLHWPLNALMIVNVQTLGYDFIQGPMAVWNFACFGSTAGVLLLAVRERDDAMRRTATGALLAGLLGGLTEPSLYGIHLRHRLVYRRMLVGCAAGGLTGALLGWFFPSVTPSGGVMHGVIAWSFAFTSLLTIPLFSRMWVYVASIAVAFVVPMALIAIFDYRTKASAENVDDSRVGGQDADNPQTTGEKGITLGISENAPDDDGIVAGHADAVDDADAVGADGTVGVGSAVAADADADDAVAVVAPVAGAVLPIDDVSDPVFASRALGDGVAIRPDVEADDGPRTIAAPVAGVLKTVAGTGHAFGIRADDGIEVLLHVGVDTVRLEGEGFTMTVSKGERVRAGDPLATVDFAELRRSGVDATTMMTITNTAKMTSVTPLTGFDAAVGDPVIAVRR